MERAFSTKSNPKPPTAIPTANPASARGNRQKVGLAEDGNGGGTLSSCGLDAGGTLLGKSATAKGPNPDKNRYAIGH